METKHHRTLPLEIGKGASHNRTNDFLTTKTRIININNPSKRFQPQTNVIAYNDSSLQSTAQSNNQQSEGTKKVKGNKYNLMNDEVGYGKEELPPLWVDIQESIDEKIKEMDDKFEKLQKLREQRFKPKFNEEEDYMLDAQINDLVGGITNSIKASEKELRDMMKEEFENEKDIQIRKNIQQSYLFKLQELTQQLRKLEKDHLVKVQNLYGEEGEVFLRDLERKEQDFFADLDPHNREMIQMEHRQEQQKGRSKDIDRLVNQINDLAVLFKDLSNLVIEQGTILDRIDYNVLESKKHVQMANVELAKTLKREKSWRARGCMGCLVTGILVNLVLLYVKHGI